MKRRKAIGDVIEGLALYLLIGFFWMWYGWNLRDKKEPVAEPMPMVEVALNPGRVMPDGDLIEYPHSVWVPLAFVTREASRGHAVTVIGVRWPNEEQE